MTDIWLPENLQINDVLYATINVWSKVCGCPVRKSGWSWAL